jgi:predicted alpha-1,6-mannanase (GH76 family)
MMRKIRWFAFFLAICSSQSRGQETAVAAMPFLHPLFSENAVLQRDRVTSIWGWTEPGDTVLVKLDDRQQATEAGQDGRWAVSIPPHAAGGPHTLTVTNQKTGESIERRNILFGDIWLCSGQSNMAFDVRGTNNAEQEIAAANYPNLRLLRVPMGTLTAVPHETFDNGTWQVCTSKSIIDFAAVGYYFGRDLHLQLNVPIGLIDSSAAGTVAQAWTSAPALGAIPDFKQAVDALTGNPNAPQQITDPNTPTVLFNVKIAPLLPGQVKGIIWYQGESNGDRKEQAVQYRALLPTLIVDWRKRFGSKTPFYIIQLSNFRATHDQPTDADVWPLLRETQLLASEQTNAPLIVTIDLGEVKNVHYHDKQTVGIRLAKSVLNHTYGTPIESSGPMLRRAQAGNGAMELVFDHANGLFLKGDANRVFAVAGANTSFVWATPRIDGNIITLRSPTVAAPIYARFAWSDNPLATLYNSANIPASPFRTSQQDESASGSSSDPISQRADAAFDAWNDAFLVREKGQTYYSRTLTSLGTESEGSWVFALDLEVAEDAYERTRSPEHRQLVIDLLHTFLTQNNHDWADDTWNDDLAWMTIAVVRGYMLTGEKTCLEKAIHGWNVALDRGWDTKYGGGGVWENMDNFVHGDGKADKLALSNTSLVMPGVMLYQITGDTSYLKKSEAMYDWIRRNVFDQTTGQVNEGVKWIIGKPDSGWLENSNNVYNSGSFVQAADALYRVTGDERYYNDAILAIQHLMKNPVLADGGRYQTQWQYRFIKALAQFATNSRLWPQYYPWLLQNAQAAWDKRDSRNLTWNDWLHATDDPKINANETSSAAAIWQVLPRLKRPELSGVFVIQNAGGKLALGVVSPRTDAPVMLQAPGASNFTLWTFQPSSGGYFQIRNARSGMVMTVDGASVAPGAKVVQRQTQGLNPGNDQWWVVRNADATFSFYNHNSNQALNIPDSEGSEEGTHLNQWFANDGASQRFTLVPRS